jgi:hypothetical protein
MARPTERLSRPLRRVLGIAPSRTMPGGIRFSALAEGHDLGRIDPGCHASCLPGFDRVGAIEPQLALNRGPPACVGKPHVRVGPAGLIGLRGNFILLTMMN